MILPVRQFLTPLQLQCIFRDAKKSEMVKKIARTGAPQLARRHPQPGYVSSLMQRPCQKHAAPAATVAARRPDTARISCRITVSRTQGGAGKAVGCRAGGGTRGSATVGAPDPPVGRHCAFSRQSPCAWAPARGGAAEGCRPTPARRFPRPPLPRSRWLRREPVRCCRCSPLSSVRHVVPERPSVFGGALRPPREWRLRGSSVPGREVALCGPPLVC
jgi:hypothetical protein